MPGVSIAAQKLTCLSDRALRMILFRNKLVMVTLATEHRQTLEVEEVPIRPSKPFYFSKVAAYAGEEGHASDDPSHA